MPVAAIVLLVLGVVLLVVSVVLFLAARRKQGSWQRMLGSGGRTAAELRQIAGSVRHDLAGSGGSAGSYAECVWHRVQVERRVRQTVRRNDAVQTETRTEIASDVRSQLPFAISDGTGI